MADPAFPPFPHDRAEESTAPKPVDVPPAEEHAEPIANSAEIPEPDPLADARAEAADWKDRALRAQAELENGRKRAARDQQESIRFANARLLEDLLPVLDNFQFGLKAAESDQSSIIYQGMAMVARQIDDFLVRNGLVEVSTAGKFDPAHHDAMEQRASDEVPEGEIVAVIRRGFTLHDRLLRPASVVVSSGPAPDGAGGAKEA